MKCKNQAVFLHLSPTTFAENSRNMDINVSFIPQTCQNLLLHIFSVKSPGDSLPFSLHLMWDMEAFLFPHTHEKKERGPHFSASSSSKKLEILGKNREFSAFSCHWKKTDGLQGHFMSHVRKGRWELLPPMAVKGHRHPILHSS